MGQPDWRAAGELQVSPLRTCGASVEMTIVWKGQLRDVAALWC